MKLWKLVPFIHIFPTMFKTCWNVGGITITKNPQSIDFISFFGCWKLCFGNSKIKFYWQIFVTPQENSAQNTFSTGICGKAKKRRFWQKFEFATKKCRSAQSTADLSTFCPKNPHRFSTSKNHQKSQQIQCFA